MAETTFREIIAPHYGVSKGEMILKVAVHIAQIRTGCAELIAVL